ncbi:MAG: hypothetical protein H7236_12175 [Gemmatimonadaceae bacterium]|nr:hypothetical protein [Caulobacter sp.]
METEFTNDFVIDPGETLKGGAGNDVFQSYTTDRGDGFNGTPRSHGFKDQFDGGAGFDIVSYAGEDPFIYMGTLVTSSYWGGYGEEPEWITEGVFTGAAYPLFQGVYVDLGAGHASGGDVLISIEGAIGTAYDDTLIGSASANFLDGGEGNDSLSGGGGSDTLMGGGGEDLLNGGAGADTMIGGDGGDIYFVDAKADVVQEDAGGGYDTVYTTATFVATAGSEIEIVIADGSGAINLTGNGSGIELWGNGNINTLDDGGGAAAMQGHGGNDVYVVHNAATQVVELANDGYDAVKTDLAFYTLTDNVEVLTHMGAGAFHGVGNALANVITGGAGNDTLDGAGGNDFLTGGAGADVFAFDNLKSGLDWITDFKPGEDHIGLDAAGFGLSSLAGVLLVDGDTATAAGVATLHYYANGAIAFDANGGAATDAVRFAGLQGHPGLSMSDFVLV